MEFSKFPCFAHHVAGESEQPLLGFRVLEVKCASVDHPIFLLNFYSDTNVVETKGRERFDTDAHQRFDLIAIALD